MTSSFIYVVKETSFQVKGEDRVLICEDIIAAYASIDEARGRAKDGADRFERQHYMADFKREVESKDFIALATGKYVFTFSVVKTSLCGKQC